MTWVYVLSKKSDVAETVKTDWLPMVERQQDWLVKAIRTDRGGEFLSKEFGLWLKKNGIRHFLTMPYSPAVESELKSIEENGVWELVELPEGRNAITSKGLFKIKSDTDGKIERYKSRLVAKGYQQKEKVEYKELFAPVVKPMTLRTLLAGATIKGWVVKQMDVTTAFLNGVIEEEIFMAQPEGFDDGSGRVLRLKKALYGVKQAPRQCYLKLRGVLEEIGFTPSTVDHSLFMLGEGEQRSFMVVYVADILIFSPSSDLMKEVMQKLQDKFKCKALGDVSFYLGLHIERDVEKRCMRVHQRKYLEALAANFGHSGGHAATPFPSGFKCVKGPEEESVDGEERRRFHLLVGSLMYAVVNTRPDVAFATGQLARVVQCPNEEQVAAGMRVAKYLGQTATVGLQYSAAAQRHQKGADGVEPGRLFLTAFSDASYASEPEDMTSVGGFICCVGGGQVFVFFVGSYATPCLRAQVVEVMLKLQDKFKCKALGDVSFYLGLHIERDVEKRCMRVHQRKYLEALAANFGQSEGHVATPFPSGFKCVKGPEEESVGEEERRRFHSLVGSLMYAAVNTRPDVAFATEQLARVVQCPNEEQVAAGMRVAKYLGQTPTVGLQYSAAAQRRQKGADGVEPGRLFLTPFSDASYASEPEDMTSVGGFICCVGGGPTAWESKKQVDQALSSMETEYMALFRAVREIVWQQRLLVKLGEEQQGPTPLYCDSQGAISLAKNPVLHGLTKHMRTFSPTPKTTALRVLLYVATQHDYELHSLDFSTAFLQGSLHEEIWLRRPPGFTGSFPAGTQLSLRRPVYGLRQAPHEWHDTLRTTLAALGFAPSSADPSLFLRTDTTLPPFYVLVYVDDLVFATADTEALAHVKAQRTITLTQRFSFTYSSPLSTPLPTGHSLSAPPSDESVELSGPYRELVGCLISSGMGLVLGGRARVVLTAPEVEIYAGAMAAQKLRWLTYLLTDLGEAPRSPPVLYQRGQLRLAYVASQANTVDVFTKALQPCDHQHFCTVLGLVPTVPNLLTS
ncbi:unnamed protein product [Closterium sp. NIES-53]